MLLTRLPLPNITIGAFDLHVLGAPPALILSQDQTLRKELSFDNCLGLRQCTLLLPDNKILAKSNSYSVFKEQKYEKPAYGLSKNLSLNVSRKKFLNFQEESIFINSFSFIVYNITHFWGLVKSFF